MPSLTKDATLDDVVDAINALQTQPSRGSTIMALGDSISAAGYSGVNIPGGQLGQAQSGQSYLLWATMLSGGRLRFAGSVGTGGFTAAQILATWVPTVVAAGPGMCVVLAGTNDTVSGTDLSSLQTWISTMTAIYQTLLAAGITPVCCTLPPRNDGGFDYTFLTAQNAWITRYARTRGLPLVDFHAALSADSGQYTATYNADNVHPTARGAKVMGQALWNALSPTLPAGAPLLADSQPGSDTSHVVGNGLFLVDTNVDGVPDNWSTFAGATSALATDVANFGARSGKVWTITRTSANPFTNSTAVTVAPGHKLYWAVKFGTTGVEAAGGSIDIRLCDNTATTDLFALFNHPIYDAGGMEVYTISGEVQMPTGLPSNQIMTRFGLRTGGVLKLAQFTIFDLTALGLA